MSDEKKTRKYADIWGDTVDLKHLAGSMIIGIILGLSFYLGGLAMIQKLRPELVLSLQKALGLVVGIVGCLLAAVISSKLFPPKRTFSEASFSPEDRERIISELNINVAEEQEAMATMPKEVVDEMKELQIYDLFKNIGKKKGDS